MKYAFFNLSPLFLTHSTNREDLVELLLPVFTDAKSSMEVIGITALACGLICVGTCNEDVTTTILQGNID